MNQCDLCTDPATFIYRVYAHDRWWSSWVRMLPRQFVMARSCDGHSSRVWENVKLLIKMMEIQ